MYAAVIACCCTKSKSKTDFAAARFTAAGLMGNPTPVFLS